MDQRTKKWVVFIGGIVVALMFISSYAAVNNNNLYGTTTSTTTVPNVKTNYAAGLANAIVTGYSPNPVITLKNLSLSNAISSQLLKLQTNGSISSFIQYNKSTYQVLINNTSAYKLQQYFSSTTPNSVIVNDTSSIALPQRVPLFVAGYGNVPVLLTQKNFSINILPLPPIGSNTPVYITALIAPNGTVWNNQALVRAN